MAIVNLLSSENTNRFTPLRGELTSFGEAEEGKVVKKASVTLQGTVNGSSWTTLAEDTYKIKKSSGFLQQRIQDDSDVDVDWTNYLDYQEAGNQAFRVTYKVKNGSTVTQYTHEAITFEDSDPFDAEGEDGGINLELGVDLYVDEIHAELGDIGGWEITETTISGGNAVLSSAGILTLGTDDDVVILDASHETYRLRAGRRYQYGQQPYGFQEYGDYPFRVTKDGTIYSTLGYIGGWQITSDALISGGMTLNSTTERITIGSTTPNIVLDGYYKYIQSSDFASGISGFSINARTGDAEFNNLAVRGELRASVFKVSEITATAGTFGVFYSASSVYEDFTTPAAVNTSYTFKAKNSDMGAPLFSIGSIVRIKTWDGSGIRDVWSTVTARAPADVYSTYTATLKSGSLNANIPKGTAIVDYGESGTGFITLSADRTVGYSPNMTMASHAGSPWATQTLLLRTGNLNGSYGYDTDVYGFATGQYGTANKPSITIESTNGIRIIGGSGGATTLGQWDTSGNITVGQVAANKGNVHITSGAVKLRTNLTDKIVLDTSGNATFGETGSGKANLYWQASDSSLILRIDADPYVVLSSGGIYTRALSLETQDSPASGTDLDIQHNNRSYLRITQPIAAFNLRSINAGNYSGHLLIIQNETNYVMTIRNNDSGGSGVELFTLTGADIVIRGFGSAIFVYNSDVVPDQWFLISYSGGAKSGYAAFTGSINRGTTYATGSISTAELAARVNAIQTDLNTYGILQS